MWWIWHSAGCAAQWKHPPWRASRIWRWDSVAVRTECVRQIGLPSRSYTRPVSLALHESSSSTARGSRVPSGSSATSLPVAPSTWATTQMSAIRPATTPDTVAGTVCSAAGVAVAGTVCSAAGVAVAGTVCSAAGVAVAGTVCSAAGVAVAGTVCSAAGVAVAGTVCSAAGVAVAGTVCSAAGVAVAGTVCSAAGVAVAGTVCSAAGVAVAGTVCSAAGVAVAGTVCSAAGVAVAGTVCSAAGVAVAGTVCSAAGVAVAGTVCSAAGVAVAGTVCSAAGVAVAGTVCSAAGVAVAGTVCSAAGVAVAGTVCSAAGVAVGVACSSAAVAAPVVAAGAACSAAGVVVVGFVCWGEGVEGVGHALAEAAAAGSVGGGFLVGVVHAGGLRAQPVGDASAGHGVELAAEMDHPVVAVPDTNTAPRPRTAVLGLSVVAVAVDRPPASLSGELLGTHRHGLRQQIPVAVDSSGAGRLGSFGQPPRVRRGHPPRLDRLTRRGRLPQRLGRL